MSEKRPEEHSSFIKTPKQLVVVVVLAFLIPIGLIVMLTQLVTRSQGINPHDPAFSEEAIAHRLKPVGEVVFAEQKEAAAGKAPAAMPAAKPAPAPAAAAVAPKPAAGGGNLAEGKTVFQGTCIACHGTGVLGAPKAGNKADWEPRIKTGMNTLYHAALHGLKAMPPKGGNASLSDQQVKDAVDYMVSLVK